MKQLFNIKQKEDEQLTDFTKRFKPAREVMVAQLGGIISLEKFVVEMEDYDENDESIIDMCQREEFAQLMAYIYLENSDKLKYGSLITSLASQFVMNNNQYPKKRWKQ